MATIAAGLPTTRAGAARPTLGPAAAGAIMAGGALALALVDPTHGPVLCPFRAVTGMYCPGCGTTRGLHELLTGHAGRAFGYNALTMLAMPFMAWAFFASLTVSLGGPRLPTIRLSTRWSQVLLGVALVWWVVRNLPFTPFSSLRPIP